MFARGDAVCLVEAVEFDRFVYPPGTAGLVTWTGKRGNTLRIRVQVLYPIPGHAIFCDAAAAGLATPDLTLAVTDTDAGSGPAATVAAFFPDGFPTTWIQERQPVSVTSPRPKGKVSRTVAAAAASPPPATHPDPWDELIAKQTARIYSTPNL